MKKIMSFLMISFIIAINIHVHAVSDYDGEAWQPIDSCRPNHGKPISHAPRPPSIIRGGSPSLSSMTDIRPTE